MYLLALFIVQNSKKILEADPELWGCATFVPICSKQILVKTITFISPYWPLSLCQIFKNVLRVDLELWGCTIFEPKMVNMGKYLPKWEFFSEKPLIKLVLLIHGYLHYKNQSINEILIIKKYWNLIGQEPFIFYHNLRTRFFPGMQFSQNVNEP